MVFSKVKSCGGPPEGGVILPLYMNQDSVTTLPFSQLKCFQKHILLHHSLREWLRSIVTWYSGLRCVKQGLAWLCALLLFWGLCPFQRSFFLSEPGHFGCTSWLTSLPPACKCLRCDVCPTFIKTKNNSESLEDLNTFLWRIKLCHVKLFWSLFITSDTYGIYWSAAAMLCFASGSYITLSGFISL